MINRNQLIRKKKALFERVHQLAFQYEQEHHYCSQCTVAALLEVLKIRSTALFSASYSLGGGLANTGEGTCGALAGGAMVISYLYGRTPEEFFNSIPNKKSIDLTKKLFDRFNAEYHGILCKEVHLKLFGRSFNLWDKKEKEIFEKLGGHLDKCPSVVANVAQWTLEIIGEEIEIDKEKGDL